MFHPVGSQPPSIYWRRRLVLSASIIALVVLAALTARVAFSDDSGSPSAAGGTPTASHPPSPHPSKSHPAKTPSSSASHTASSSKPAKPSTSKSSTAPPQPCSIGALALAAVTSAPSYTVGSQPVLSIQVTNTGTAACVVDLADPQIVLRVYNGESRVWGSHDCKIEPGTDKRTLMAGASVKVSIVWSGLSSQPNCAGTRERAGAGTYTLYASLAGHDGKAAQFSLT